MYASAQSLQDRYPTDDLIQLTDPAAQAIDVGRLDRALGDASAEIDGYLMGRYQLPLSQVPKVLELLACDIAMYRLQALRPLGDIEDARSRYQDAVRYLSRVSKGEVQLGLSEDNASPAESSGPEVITAARTFTRDAMRGL